MTIFCISFLSVVNAGLSMRVLKTKVLGFKKTKNLKSPNFRFLKIFLKKPKKPEVKTSPAFSGVARILRQGGTRFGFVKRPKIINVYRTTPGSILPSRPMRYCIRPVCHSHTIRK